MKSKKEFKRKIKEYKEANKDKAFLLRQTINDVMRTNVYIKPSERFKYYD